MCVLLEAHNKAWLQLFIRFIHLFFALYFPICWLPFPLPFLSPLFFLSFPSPPPVLSAIVVNAAPKYDAGFEL